MKIIDPSYSIEDEIDGMRMLASIEKAGRTCYKSEDKMTQDTGLAFISKIISSGHHSVLEHEKVSVRIICDRGITHEIVRHRLASYAQESTRWCNYAGGNFNRNIGFVPPMNLTSDNGGYTHRYS